jgi:hypothetical protein
MIRSLIPLSAIVLLCLSILGWNCAASKQASTPSDKLAQLLTYMTGDFSSQAQSQRDTDYFDIRLHIRPIWLTDKANHWLYVEQATAKSPEKPYRQRVYKVEKEGENGFKSIVYTIDEPAKWIGAFKNPVTLDQYKPANLLLREGCTVFLQAQKDGTFKGATQGEGCESNLRGAKYAISTVTISDKMLLSWDQGFNDKKVQVWGATKGGYAFIKQ